LLLPLHHSRLAFSKFIKGIDDRCKTKGSQAIHTLWIDSIATSQVSPDTLYDRVDDDIMM
jgi:hypothetical protein